MSYNFQNTNKKNNNNYIDLNPINVKINNEQNQINKHVYKNNMNYYNDNEKKNNEKIGGKNTNNKSESLDFDFENIDLEAYFGSQLRGNSQSVRQTSKKSFKRIKQNKLYITKTNFSIPSSNNSIFSKNIPLNNNNNNYNIFTSKNDIMKNLCHGFIDCFFSQKDELENIKSEIQKLQWMFINSHITSTNAGYYMGQMPIINNNNNNVKYVISSENKISYLSDNKKKNDYSENQIENYSATFGKKKEKNVNHVNINDSNVKKLDFIDNNNSKDDNNINNPNNKNLKKSLSFDNLFSTANKINEKKDNFPEIIKEQDEENNPSNEKILSQNNNITNEINSQQIDEMENMKNINLKDIKDEEFDSFLNGLKNKKNSLPNNEKKTNTIQNKKIEIQGKKKNSFQPVSTSQKDLIETDFIAGNKKATYKPNEKTKKLLEEMDKDIRFYDDIDDASKTKSKIKKMFPEKKSIIKKRNYKESIKNSNSKENNNSKTNSSKKSINDNISPINESSDENEEINIKKKLMKYPAYRINKQISKDKEVKKENNNKDEKEKIAKNKLSKDLYNHNNENENNEEELQKKEVIPLKIQNFQ